MEFFAGTDIDMHIDEGFRSAVWHKRCPNAAGVVPFVVGKPLGIAHNDTIADLLREIVRKAACDRQSAR